MTASKHDPPKSLRDVPLHPHVPPPGPLSDKPRACAFFSSTRSSTAYGSTEREREVLVRRAFETYAKGCKGATPGTIPVHEALYVLADMGVLEGIDASSAGCLVAAALGKVLDGHPPEPEAPRDRAPATDGGYGAPSSAASKLARGLLAVRRNVRTLVMTRSASLGENERASLPLDSEERAYAVATAAAAGGRGEVSSDEVNSVAAALRTRQRKPLYAPEDLPPEVPRFDVATEEALARALLQFASAPPKKRRDQYGRELPDPSPTLTPAQFASLVLHADLLDPAFTPHAVGVVFARARGAGKRKMSAAALHRAVAIVAAEKGVALMDVARAVIGAPARRSVARAARAASGSVVSACTGTLGPNRFPVRGGGATDDAKDAAEARKMAAMFHALDPEKKGWVSSIEALFLLDDAGAFDRLPADVAAEVLTCAGAPVSGVNRSVAAVTLLDATRYAASLRDRAARGGLVPEAVAVPPNAERRLKSLARRFASYAEPCEREGSAPRLSAEAFERFCHESDLLVNDIDAAAAAAASSSTSTSGTVKDAGGTGRFTLAAADVAFVRACLVGRSSLDFAGFLRALAMTAAARGETFEKVTQVVLAAAARDARARVSRVPVHRACVDAPSAGVRRGPSVESVNAESAFVADFGWDGDMEDAQWNAVGSHSGATDRVADPAPKPASPRARPASAAARLSRSPHARHSTGGAHRVHADRVTFGSHGAIDETREYVQSPQSPSHAVASAAVRPSSARPASARPRPSSAVSSGTAASTGSRWTTTTAGVRSDKPKPDPATTKGHRPPPLGENVASLERLERTGATSARLRTLKAKGRENEARGVAKATSREAEDKLEAMRLTMARKAETRERLERACRRMDDKAAMVPVAPPRARPLFANRSGRIEYAEGVHAPASDIFDKGVTGPGHRPPDRDEAAQRLGRAGACSGFINGDASGTIDATARKGVIGSPINVFTINVASGMIASKVQQVA